MRLETRIREALWSLEQRYPELGRLISRIAPSLDIDAGFLRAYFSSKVPYGRRSLVLRVLLADPRLLGTTIGETLTLGALQRIVQYLTAHPAHPLDLGRSTFAREDIPSHLRRGLLGARGDVLPFLDRMLLSPYVEKVCGRGAHPWADASLGDVSGQQGLERVLRPVFDAFVLDPQRANAFLHHPKDGGRLHHYFATSVEGVSWYNALLLLDALLKERHFDSAQQDRLTHEWANVLGIRAYSFPDALVAADLIGLSWSGVIATAALAPEADFLGTRMLHARVRRFQAALDYTPILKGFTTHFFLDPRRSGALMQAGRGGAAKAMFLTGLTFNVPRLVSGQGRMRGALARYRRYYALVDEGVLLTQVCEHFGNVAPEFLPVLKRAIKHHPDLFGSIRARDTANAVFHVWWQEQKGYDRHAILPNVARYALGEAEPRPGQGTSPRAPAGRARRRSHADRRRIVRLELLDELL